MWITELRDPNKTRQGSNVIHPQLVTQGVTPGYSSPLHYCLLPPSI